MGNQQQIPITPLNSFADAINDFIAHPNTLQVYKCEICGAYTKFGEHDNFVTCKSNVPIQLLEDFYRTITRRLKIKTFYFGPSFIANLCAVLADNDIDITAMTKYYSQSYIKDQYFTVAVLCNISKKAAMQIVNKYPPHDDMPEDDYIMRMISTQPFLARKYNEYREVFLPLVLEYFGIYKDIACIIQKYIGED